MKENGSRWHPLARQRTSEQELMQWFIEFVIADMYVINFPDCGNSDNEVTDCTVSSQHFAGVETRCWERLPAPASWIIRRRHHSPKHYLNANVSLTLGTSSSCGISSLWDERNTRPSWSVREGHHSKSTVNTAQIWTLICIIIIITIIITHTTIIIIIIM